VAEFWTNSADDTWTNSGDDFWIDNIAASTDVVPDGWLAYKGLGPWDFTEQYDVWGYLNNRRWTDEQSTPVNYSGNESNEPQIWTVEQDYVNRVGTEHHPCGHWHKRSGEAAPVLTDKANIWGITSLGGSVAPFGGIWAVYFDGSKLHYRGAYEPINKDINGLAFYEDQLITIAGNGSTAEIRTINKTTMELNQIFTPFNNYDIIQPTECKLLNGFSDKEIWYIDADGLLVQLNTHIKQSRSFWGTVVTGTDSNLYRSLRGVAGFRPIDQVGYTAFWEVVADNLTDGTVYSWSTAPFYTANAVGVHAQRDSNYIYISSWDSPYNNINVIDPGTFNPVSEIDSFKSRRMVILDSHLYTIAGLNISEIKKFRLPSGSGVPNLTYIDTSTSFDGYFGDIDKTSDYIIAGNIVYTTTSGLYKIDPNDLSIVDFTTGVECQRIATINDQFVVVGSNNSVSVYDVTDMSLVDTLALANDPNGFGQTEVIVENIYE